jgi:hypothetical protein
MEIITIYTVKHTLSLKTPIGVKQPVFAVSTIQETINEYTSLLNIDAEVDDDEINEELDEIDEQKTIPNYSDYVVDSSIPHTLYEDFTHKKVIAFSFNNERYEAKDWKDLLLQTCDLLAEIDVTKFSD